MSGAARGIMSAQRRSHYSGSPTYRTSNDPSLDRLSDAVKAKKQSIIDQLQTARTAYDRTADKNRDWMLVFSPTVIVPLIYYFGKGIIMESLPYNRKDQCERLIEVVKAIGTTSSSGDGFIDSELHDLFQTLKSGKSDKLMSLLVEVYRLNREVTVTGYKILPYSVNQHITFFTKQKLVEHMIPDLADLVAEYSEDAPKVEEKKSSNGSAPSSL